MMQNIEKYGAKDVSQVFYMTYYDDKCFVQLKEKYAKKKNNGRWKKAPPQTQTCSQAPDSRKQETYSGKQYTLINSE